MDKALDHDLHSCAGVVIRHTGGLIVCRRDPGIANWLDSCGRSEGQILFRNYVARDTVVPVARKVKFDELMADLPADTVRVAPEQRKADLEYRREGYLKLYGE